MGEFVGDPTVDFLEVFLLLSPAGRTSYANPIALITSSEYNELLTVVLQQDHNRLDS